MKKKYGKEVSCNSRLCTKSNTMLDFYSILFFQSQRTCWNQTDIEIKYYIEKNKSIKIIQTKKNIGIFLDN